MRISALCMVLLGASIIALPMNRAFAGQALEIPRQEQSAGSPGPAPVPSAAPHRSDPAPYTDNSPVPGTGSVSDYMHQQGDPASATASYPSQPAGGYAYSTANDPRSNSSQLLTAALVGGAIIGLIALSNYSAHHQHRR